MTDELKAELRKDFAKFHEMTRKFYNKEITVPEYKAFSGGFGSYAQRGGERSMLRLRLAGGDISKENLKFIADSIAKYKIDRVHLTTCQTVQLHDLTQDTVCSLIEEAYEHGIITLGGGGDFPRNVMCSPRSGVAEDEFFDVLPYAKAAADYLLGLIRKVKLPRKLKVCFSNREENETHATFRDLGFVATERGTFDVYAAGGLGIKPKMGVKVVTDLDPVNVLCCIKTMVDVFTEYGNYENRAASRSRFLQDLLGIEGLQKVFAEKLKRNLTDDNLKLEIYTLKAEYNQVRTKELNQEFVTESTVGKHKVVIQTDIVKKGDGVIEHRRVLNQKQPGLYTVSYHPIGGMVEPDFFGKLYHTIHKMDDVTVRISPNQGLYIINLTAEEAAIVLSLTEGGAENVFERSTACIGAAVCQVGIGNSQELLEACVRRVREEHFKDGVLPAIHISGCPSSCAAHQIGTISFRGGKKPTPDGPKFAFAVYVDGCEEYGKEEFAGELGVMLATDIPEFLVDVGKRVAELEITYSDYRTHYPGDLEKLAEKYL